MTYPGCGYAFSGESDVLHGHEKVTSAKRLAVVFRFKKRSKRPAVQPVARSVKRRVETPMKEKPKATVARPEKETPEKEEGVRKSDRLNTGGNGKNATEPEGMLDVKKSIIGTLEMKRATANRIQRNGSVVVDWSTKLGKRVGKLKRWEVGKEGNERKDGGASSVTALTDVPKVVAFLEELSRIIPGYKFAYAHCKLRTYYPCCCSTIVAGYL